MPFPLNGEDERDAQLRHPRSPLSSSHREGCNFGEGYVKRGSFSLMGVRGPVRNQALYPKQSRSVGRSVDRGVKEMAVNNKVAAAGRCNHAREREPNLRVLREAC